MMKSLLKLFSTSASLALFASLSHAQFVKTKWERYGQYCVAYDEKTKLYNTSPVFPASVVSLGRELEFKNSTVIATNSFLDCDKMNHITYQGTFESKYKDRQSYAAARFNLKLATTNICISGENLEKLPIDVVFRFMPDTDENFIIGRVDYRSFPGFRDYLAGYAAGVVMDKRAKPEDFAPCFTDRTFIEFKFKRTNKPVPEWDTSGQSSY